MRLAKSKVKSERALLVALGKLRKGRKKPQIVFTNGCFDLLHAGHVSYLERARKLGDLLIVALNSDPSVRRLKGETRPLNPLADRLAVLAALECIDFVTSFEEDTPARIIEAISPDILVKGGDYTRKEIVGADFVLARGGRVRALPFLGGRSTSRIIAQIHDSEPNLKNAKQI